MRDPPTCRVRKVDRLLREALEPASWPARWTSPGLGLVTVTRVDVTADLQTARVFVSLFGAADPEAGLERLRKRSGWPRGRLAARVQLKYNPTLFFSWIRLPSSRTGWNG